jgi:hypothetical protein
VESPALREVTELGDGLFHALFTGEVRDLYRTALACAERDGKGLRVKLSMTDAPEFATLPWEFLYDDPSFLAISQLTPVVRYLDLARTRHPRELAPPLRILAMVSSPTDAEPLDTKQERKNVEQALEQVRAEGAVELCWLENATLPALLDKLREDEFHIFHYIGHGGYKEVIKDGVLLLEDDGGRLGVRRGALADLQAAAVAECPQHLHVLGVQVAGHHDLAPAGVDGLRIQGR